MTRFATQTIAICAALFLTLGTIGTIITVPPAYAASPISAAALA